MEKGTYQPEVIIVRYGYEYHLVECIRDKGYPQAAMFEMEGFALKSVKKVKK